MRNPIPICLAVEDELSEWVLRRIIGSRPISYAIGPVYGRTGFGYLKRQVSAFNNAAKGCPFLLLTDLDEMACAPQLITDWLDRPRHPNFLLRVAIREVESWLLADDTGITSFLGSKLPAEYPEPEQLTDPKQELLKASFRSPRLALREALVWQDQSSGRFRQGPDYNGILSGFVREQWNLGRATKRCSSLERLSSALARLESSR